VADDTDPGSTISLPGSGSRGIDGDGGSGAWLAPPPPSSELPRRVDKPWGNELIFAWTTRYVGKILTIETGKRLSLQYHERKDEWIHVLDGLLLLTLESDDGSLADRQLAAGEGAHVPTGRVHRYEAIETCRVFEVSTPELEDVVRIQDDFGREGTNAP
jgi:mannose-6-phosphate isomerase